MANEIIFPFDTGRTVYTMFVGAVGTFWNTAGSALETYSGANITDYDIALTELGTATGLYQGSVPALAAGYYNVIVRERSGASPAQNDANIGFGSFYWTGSAIVRFSANWNSLVVDTDGCVDASVEKWDDAAVATPATAGHPVVTIKSGTGTGEINLASGVADANVVQISGDATAADNAEAFWEGLITGSVNDGSATTTVFIGASGLSSTDDFYNGCVLEFTSGTLKGLSRRITDYVGSTRTFTFAAAWPSAPANAVTFFITGRIDQ